MTTLAHLCLPAWPDFRAQWCPWCFALHVAEPTGFSEPPDNGSDFLLRFLVFMGQWPAVAEPARSVETGDTIHRGAGGMLPMLQVGSCICDSRAVRPGLV